jgi:hypothetical protein
MTVLKTTRPKVSEWAKQYVVHAVGYSGELIPHEDEQHVLDLMLDDLVQHIRDRGYRVETMGCEEVGDLAVIGEGERHIGGGRTEDLDDQEEDDWCDDLDDENDWDEASLCLCEAEDCEQCSYRNQQLRELCGCEDHEELGGEG